MWAQRLRKRVARSPALGVLLFQLVATGGEPLSEPPPPAQPSARRDAVPEAEPPRRAREPPPPARDVADTTSERPIPGFCVPRILGI